jgi:hypothetical protein
MVLERHGGFREALDQADAFLRGVHELSSIYIKVGKKKAEPAGPAS